MLRQILPAILFLASAGQGAMPSLSVHLTAVALPPESGRVVVHVSVLPQNSKGIALTSKDVTLVDGQAQTPLRIPEGQYVLKVEAPGFWAPDYPIELASDNHDDVSIVHVRIWPTNEVTFAFDERGDAPPRELLIDFRGAPTDPDSINVPVGFTKCSGHELRARCALPVGKIDFRVVSIPPAPAFVPEYFWGVENAFAKTPSLRKLRLVAGSSLIGYVQNDYEQPVVGAAVDLATPSGRQLGPTETAFDASEPTRAAGSPRSPLHATTNERGFFQIRQPVPGEYRVIAAGKDGGFAQTQVTLHANQETALPDFLRLGTPYDLPVTIDPPVAPGGRLWSIELLRIRPVASLLRYAMGSSGMTILDGIAAGQYNIFVSSEGQRYFFDLLEVSAQPVPLHIKIPLIAVKGKITLAGEPLRARLVFGGENAPNAVALESTESGRFAGILPREGDWVVQVEASDPPVHRRLRQVSVATGSSHEADVEIKLTDARLKGQVVDQDGSLVGNALIKITPITSFDDERTYVRTETGLFELAGMSPGILALEAQTPGQLASEPVAVTLGGTEVEATLVVSEPVHLIGRVLSATSLGPIPGAMLYATAAEKPLTAAGRESADGEGRFRLPLPPHTAFATVAYWADGYSLDIAKVVVSAESEIVLSASPIGGTLSMVLPAPEELEGTVPVIVHRGAVMPAWGLASLRPEDRQVARPPASRRVVVANLAPGKYLLCVMDTRVFGLGLLRNVGSDCSSGVLMPGGELALSLPSSGETAE